MRLITLYSNDKRFKPLKFNNGLNIIVGQKILKEDKKKTSNQGKIILVNLQYVHYLSYLKG
ncbi:hypothetical protein QJU96_00190 [Pasteurella skyensis]|uniref:Uncharacterized protein n=1 Tax=Phocoenobacter skyensis TaxID=97481 RepID=A0AAJ6NC59_9PAST|nr:hypothetical protein [Pasteurella skyensis]MDP8169713.1 hypothetical protein [Pasteurella skyensis]MDP8173961.1 hypothetical protein [Pasteurella skyensis]